MEALTRMVADSLARHGFDSPVDPRRLQWSRWFRCDSPRSLLVVPSKPGIFAIAEEVMDFSANDTRVGTAASAVPPSEARRQCGPGSAPTGIPGGTALQRCDPAPFKDAALAAEVEPRRMLAVLQFSEDDDMAFTLDRMFGSANPMRTRFASGRCFLRFVVIDDQAQRRSICSALNQWMLSSAEKATGIDQSVVARAPSPAFADTVPSLAPATPSTGSKFVKVVPNVPAPHLDSGSNKNLHCPHPLPSGF